MLYFSCHCGLVKVSSLRKPKKLTQCNCAICRRYGAIWAYFQRRSIEVIDEKNSLALYSWGDKRFEFFRCSNCGCVTHYLRTEKQDDGTDMAAINVRNIDDSRLIQNVPIRLLDGASSWKVLGEDPQPYLLRSPNA